MSKDTKGTQKYTWNVVGIRVKNILYFIFFGQRVVEKYGKKTLGDIKITQLFFENNKGHQKHHGCHKC
jgi:hypothetical protein